MLLKLRRLSAGRRFTDSNIRMVGFSIAHIDSARDFRGGQEALLILARGLRTRGHRQLVICPQDSALAERARAEGFETVPPGGLRALLRAGGVQAIHAQSAL